MIRPAILAALVAISFAVDYDQLAAQRYTDERAKQAAATPAAAAAQPPADGPAWAVPKGREAKAPPPWAQGEWTTEGKPAIIVGAKTVASAGQPPIGIGKVVAGSDWCEVILNAAGGDGPLTVAFRRNDKAMSFGAVVDGKVAQWTACDRAR